MAGPAKKAPPPPVAPRKVTPIATTAPSRPAPLRLLAAPIAQSAPPPVKVSAVAGPDDPTIGRALPAVPSVAAPSPTPPADRRSLGAAPLRNTPSARGPNMGKSHSANVAARQEGRADKAASRAEKAAARQEGRTARAGSGRADAAWDTVGEIGDTALRIGGSMAGVPAEDMIGGGGLAADDDDDGTLEPTGPGIMDQIAANPIPALIVAVIGAIGLRKAGVI